MSISTHEGVALVENSGRGLQIETFTSRLAMVLSLMDNGAIGGGLSHGCTEHLAALCAIEKQLAKVRETIAHEEKLSNE